MVRPARPHSKPSAPEPLVVGAALEPVMEMLARVADAPVPILVCGETGVGKQVVAEAVHRMSTRASGPFVQLNAAAVPESLVESELFGHERGAFTGADQARAGLVEQADGGTLFLDEVGELPLPMQAKLLRVLEDRSITRLGGRGSGKVVDVRFVAATNRRLEDEVRAGRFRADLLYRLDAVRLEVPPLRQRVDEIPELARRFAEELSGQMGFGVVPRFTDAATRVLCAHRWPGNVRELRNVVQRTVLLARRGVIDVDDLPSPLRASPPDAPPPAEEAIADFTGETLTNDQGAAWNSATGNGAVMEGPIGQPNATVTGRRREGARGGAIGGTGDGEPGPRTVAVGNLSRSPGAPLNRLQQLLRQNVPRRARELGLEGDARVRIRVRADGRVVTLAVLSEDHDGFGNACRTAIRASGRWEPPLDRNGEAVDTVTTFRCTFETDF